MKKLHLVKLGTLDKRASILFWKQAADALEVPFRCPHHSASEKAVVSEVGTAAGGVIVLDDAQEFKPETLHQAICQWRAMERMRPTLVMLFSATIPHKLVQHLDLSFHNDEDARLELYRIAKSYIKAS